jgi:hypothetical protein
VSSHRGCSCRLRGRARVFCDVRTGAERNSEVGVVDSALAGCALDYTAAWGGAVDGGERALPARCSTRVMSGFCGYRRGVKAPHRDTRAVAAMLRSQSKRGRHADARGQVTGRAMTTSRAEQMGLGFRCIPIEIAPLQIVDGVCDAERQRAQVAFGVDWPVVDQRGQGPLDGSPLPAASLHPAGAHRQRLTAAGPLVLPGAAVTHSPGAQPTQRFPRHAPEEGGNNR